MTTGFLGSSRLRQLRLRSLALTLVIALAGAFTFATMADARLGGGGSSGSRGSRTYSAPSSTPTAPSVSPFQRSATPRSGPVGSGFGNSRPGFFGGGFGSGLLGGFLGAGLFGMLFGQGLTGGLGGGMSIIGLILQLGLLYLGFRLIMGFFAARRQAQPAGGNSSFFGGGPGQGNPQGNPQQNGQGSSVFGGASNNQPQGTPITIGPADYETFERRLVDSQAAYSNGDLGTLRRIATAEMAGNFERELQENDRQGVANRLSDVRLLNGDLSEAWAENGSDYATVAMHFSLVDATVEKTSGRTVAGDPGRAQEVTEVWTFRRPSGSGAQGWSLSAIQQAH